MSVPSYARAIYTTRQFGTALNQKWGFKCISVVTGKQLIASVGYKIIATVYQQPRQTKRRESIGW